MPREYVDSSWQSQDENADVNGFNRVRVSWSREAEYVQVATVNPEGETMTDADGNAEARIEGGWFVDLDRRGINDLIRHLRRARDQAFGRDE